jgi:hypothetical protein
MMMIYGHEPTEMSLLIEVLINTISIRRIKRPEGFATGCTVVLSARV